MIIYHKTEWRWYLVGENELQNIWYYFLDLEKELSDSSRYIEPNGQENVFSFEFRKIIILACTECETAFKALCEIIDSEKDRGSIADYKKIILKKYPKIVEAEVVVKRWHKTIRPFSNWDNEKIFWWEVHQNVKHDRGAYFSKATYKNATYAMGGLYILILYLYRASGVYMTDLHSDYITSKYTPQFVNGRLECELPGF